MKKNENENRLFNIRNIAFLAVILILASVLPMFRSTGGGDLAFDETGFTITDPSGKTETVLYRDITELTLAEDADYGDSAGGEASGRYHFGAWKSEGLGEYTACLSSKIPCAIVADTGNGRYVFNYESENTTRRLFEEINKYL